MSADGIAVDVVRLQALAAELAGRNSQLERALSSRISIEQAKGILAERFELEMDEAFELLRRAARSSRRRIHDLAEEVVSERLTPAEIDLERARPLVPRAQVRDGSRAAVGGASSR